MVKARKINIRLSEDEIKMLKAQAAQKGLGISAYIRMLIYDKRPRRRGKIGIRVLDPDGDHGSL